MIRQAIASGRTQVAVAREFGVSNVQVRNIALRRSWSHVQ
jgi:transposase-like protein